MAAARVWAQHCVLDDNHSKTGLNLLFGTPLGYLRHYRLMLLHYFRRRIATVERREASVPRHGKLPVHSTPCGSIRLDLMYYNVEIFIYRGSIALCPAPLL